MHAFGTSTEWYCQPSAAWCRYIDNVGHETSHQKNTPVTDNPLSYSGYRFPPDVISYAVWLYYRFPLSLRMVEELLAARGIELTYETVRRWAVKFGLGIARRIRSAALARGDKWHLEKWSSRLTARSTGCGARWTSMARCSMCWCKADATGMQPGSQAAHAQAVKEARTRPTCTGNR
jgi:hypothetical protein